MRRVQHGGGRLASDTLAEAPDQQLLALPVPFRIASDKLVQRHVQDEVVHRLVRLDLQRASTRPVLRDSSGFELAVELKQTIRFSPNLF